MSSIRTKLRTPIHRIADSFFRRLRPAQGTVVFSAGMTIDSAWNAHSKAPEVFARHHLPACHGCAVRFDESLAEATEAYGIDLDKFLRELNSLRQAG